MNWETIVKQSAVDEEYGREALLLIERALAYMRESYSETKDERMLKLSEDIGELVAKYGFTLPRD